MQRATLRSAPSTVQARGATHRARWGLDQFGYDAQRSDVGPADTGITAQNSLA